jgi:ribosomal protein L11
LLRVRTDDERDAFSKAVVKGFNGSEKGVQITMNDDSPSAFVVQVPPHSTGLSVATVFQLDGESVQERGLQKER